MDSVGNQNKVTENSNLKNNDKCIIQVQVHNIGSSHKIKFQVRNIDSYINLNTTRQKRAKNKSISIKKS